MSARSVTVIGVSVLTVFALLAWIGIDRVATTIVTINPLTLVGVFILFMGVLFIASVGVWLLLQIFGRVSYRTFLPLFLASWSIGSFLPGRVGDFSIAFFHSRLKLTTDQLALSVFFDKLVTLVSIIILGWISIQQGIVTDPFIQNVVLVGTIILLGIVVGFLFALTLFKNLLQKLLNRLFGSRFSGLVEHIRKNNARIVKGYPHILGNFAITFIRLGVQGVALWLLLVGFGATVSVELTILFLGLSSLSVFVPFTLGGAGVRESLLVILFGLAGVPAAIAGSAAFTQLILHYLHVGGLGVYFGQRFKDEWDSQKNKN